MARDDESRSILAELALDACLAVRDYAFSELGLATMLTCYKTGNAAAAAINKACGMMPSERTEGGEDGMTYLKLTRQHWEKIRGNSQ
jgi:RimJ/RimL family protein N-acetyltransferase